ncbi:hypothetical protein IFM89_027912 [Coptis chinensis]|uniref:C2 domain-containing protein n=1 Tax=Coptis chinensis TaxID=261450 RepID=A0A835LK13_9MAGN|nr:hypothetical protein IFM89_027912 [Coptis chinensis]
MQMLLNANGKVVEITTIISVIVPCRTYVISNNDNPVWTQHFSGPVAHHAVEAHFVVKDSDIVGSQVIGVVAITVENIISGNKIEGSFQILNMSNKKPCNPGAVLKISIQYIPIERLTARSSRCHYRGFSQVEVAGRCEGAAFDMGRSYFKKYLGFGFMIVAELHCLRKIS